VQQEKEKLKIKILIAKHKAEESRLQKLEWEQMQKHRIESEKDLLERESRTRRASLDAELEDVESRSGSACKPNKVVTHDCSSSGFHKVEYITYKYSHGSCKKHVKVEKEPCGSSASQVDGTSSNDDDNDDASIVQEKSENIGKDSMKDNTQIPDDPVIHEI